jgi:thioredoxin reductase (NADPH)
MKVSPLSSRRRLPLVTAESDRRLSGMLVTTHVGRAERSRISMIDPQDVIDGPRATRNEILDCVLVGGGPAGLTAGLYLRRFHRNVRVVDAGAGRARRISRSNNVAGFPDGVAGAHLLGRMKRHLQQVGGHVNLDTVREIRRRGDGLFTIGPTHELLWAGNVILCNGVMDRLPAIPGADVVESADLLRYCPVCDGYEHTGERIGVIGNSIHGVGGGIISRKLQPGRVVH